MAWRRMINDFGVAIADERMPVDTLVAEPAFELFPKAIL